LLYYGELTELKRGILGIINLVSELRITVGAGYRVYYTKKADEIIILLVGGDKSTKSKDIAKAQQLCRELEDE